MGQALWEKQYWKGSELEGNEQLRFGEAEKPSRRMDIQSSAESLFSSRYTCAFFFSFASALILVG